MSVPARDRHRQAGGAARQPPGAVRPFHRDRRGTRPPDRQPGARELRAVLPGHLADAGAALARRGEGRSPGRHPTRNLSYAATRVAGEALWQAQRRGAGVPLIARPAPTAMLDLGSTEFLEPARAPPRAVRARLALPQPRGRPPPRRGAAGLLHAPPGTGWSARPRRCAPPGAADASSRESTSGRGDYATFDGGRRFFDHSDYRRVMLEVQAAHPGRDVAFLVCSDEPVPDDAFAGLELLTGARHRARGPVRAGLVRPDRGPGEHLQPLGLVLGRGPAVHPARRPPAPFEPEGAAGGVRPGPAAARTRRDAGAATLRREPWRPTIAASRRRWRGCGRASRATPPACRCWPGSTASSRRDRPCTRTSRSPSSRSRSPRPAAAASTPCCGWTPHVRGGALPGALLRPHREPRPRRVPQREVAGRRVGRPARAAPRSA